MYKQAQGRESPERNFHVPVIKLRSDGSQLAQNLRKDW